MRRQQQQIDVVDQREEQIDDHRVEVRAASAASSASASGAATAPCTGGARQRVEDVADRDDAPDERDALAGQPGRIAVPSQRL